MSAWSWGITFTPIQCAPPSLLPQYLRAKSSPPTRVAVASRRSPSASKWAASRGKTSRFNLMAHCSVLPTNRLLLMSDAEKPMVACASCMEPVSAVAALVRYVDGVNGGGDARAVPRQVSVLLHPVTVGSASVLWHDWERRIHRRPCIHLLRHQRVEIQAEPGNCLNAASPAPCSCTAFPCRTCPLSHGMRNEMTVRREVALQAALPTLLPCF
jgi:hypothetical protein